MSLFQSNFRKQIRNLPKILNFVKIIHYNSKLFTGVLNPVAAAAQLGASPRDLERRRSKTDGVCLPSGTAVHGERPAVRLSEAARAKRQTNWRVWVIGGTGARPESPGIAGVSRV